MSVEHVHHRGHARDIADRPNHYDWQQLAVSSQFSSGIGSVVSTLTLANQV